MVRWPWQRLIFPAIIVVVLIWLALTTLGGGGNDRLRYSELLATVRQSPAQVRLVTFHPSHHTVDLKLTSGKTKTSAYPVDESAYALQQLLEQKGIAFDAKSTGSSAAWSILTSLLPFVLLFGFWIFLMRAVGRNQFKGRGSPETPDRR